MSATLSTHPPTIPSARDARAEAVRQFNRFYTLRIGVLREGLVGSEFSLTEARALWELAHQDGMTPSALSKALAVDAGYVSRIVRGFTRSGLVGGKSSPQDGRSRLLSLTVKGRRAFAFLNRRSHDESVAMMSGLSPLEQERLLQSMHIIEQLLGESVRAAAPFLIRTHRPGDIGWLVQRQAEVYVDEYGWDGSFEGFVADIAAKFVRNYDPRREQCWVAERGGERAGAVMVVARSRTIGQLRMLLVESSARGLGIGGRLVEECIRFARQARYRKLVLWTYSILLSARKIYEGAGFRLVKEEPSHSFGCDLVGQFWELKL
jgi:DNA-binding MarR family transcriptional regulator/GNAT superfamily N-acetyltransferase